MTMETAEPASVEALFDLPCACQNLRRAARILTRIYDQELKKAGIEITQFGLLTALTLTGGATQKRLSGGFAMDSTTLSRTLDRMQKRGWIDAKPGTDKREHIFELTAAGKRQLAKAQPCWNRAESRLRNQLGESGWKDMQQVVSFLTKGAIRAQNLLQPI
jgi:DNA-binding MarR family transcriptional regulator